MNTDINDEILRLADEVSYIWDKIGDDHTALAREASSFEELLQGMVKLLTNSISKTRSTLFSLYLLCEDQAAEANDMEMTVLLAGIDRDLAAIRNMVEVAVKFQKDLEKILAEDYPIDNKSMKKAFKASKRFAKGAAAVPRGQART